MSDTIDSRADSSGTITALDPQTLPVFNDRVRYRDTDLTDTVPTATHKHASLSADDLDLFDDPLAPVPYSPPTPSQGFPLHGPLRSLNYHAILSKADLIAELLKTIPLNEYGLPTYLYRPDLLNTEDFQQAPSGSRISELQSALGAATIALSYAQGFPTLPNGAPVWTQLEFEDLQSFRAFLEYIDQDGARSIHHMTEYSQSLLNEWFYTNMWFVRAKAYDMFRAAHHARVRANRIIRAENNHYSMAESLLRKVQEYIDKKGEDFVEQLTPKAAVEVLEKLVKVQRMSIGLNTSGAGDKEVPQSTSVEVTMRQVAKQSGESELSSTSGALNGVDLLKEMPDAIDLAQELILKVNKQG